MLKLLGLVTIQSSLLIAAQVLLKISISKFGKFAWSWGYFKTVLTTWQFALSGICALSSLILWMQILKKYALSVAYPLTGVSFVLALLAGMFVFHETVPLTRWIGVAVMLLGFYLIIK